MVNKGGLVFKGIARAAGNAAVGTARRSALDGGMSPGRPLTPPLLLRVLAPIMECLPATHRENRGVSSIKGHVPVTMANTGAALHYPANRTAALIPQRTKKGPRRLTWAPPSPRRTPQYRAFLSAKLTGLGSLSKPTQPD
ncbi:hypothetical protein SKAU_G00083040 [Synaphobranchus kaupii]|uniref:Uncharacterized protein n=1 Tax=Synaphobranchus kaupii TaxID=118154 RepID=A0A9Q1FV70_SYNKA|nr:hypothetical protein SKAU_G00083040 [Synaphobranchus kaupii]